MLDRLDSSRRSFAAACLALVFAGCGSKEVPQPANTRARHAAAKVRRGEYVLYDRADPKIAFKIWDIFENCDRHCKY